VDEGAFPDEGLIEVPAIVGACMAVRGSAVREAGALDDDFFFYFEEVEWCQRFRRLGWSVMVDCGLNVVHQKGAATRPFRRAAQIEMMRSRLLYYRKAFPPRTARLLTAYRYVRLTLNCLSYTVLLALCLGLWGGVRRRWLTYTTLLAWCLSGRPDEWGLPDKCPRRPADDQ